MTPADRGALLLQEASRGGKRGGGGSRGNRTYFRDRLGRFASRAGGAIGRAGQNPRLRAAGAQLKADAPAFLVPLAATMAGTGAGSLLGGGGARTAAYAAKNMAKWPAIITGAAAAANAAKAAKTKRVDMEGRDRKSILSTAALMGGLGAAGGYFGAKTGLDKGMTERATVRKGLKRDIRHLKRAANRNQKMVDKYLKKAGLPTSKDEARLRGQVNKVVKKRWKVAGKRQVAQQQSVMDEFSRTASDRWSAPKPGPRRASAPRMGPSAGGRKLHKRPKPAAGGRKPYKTPNVRQLSTRPHGQLRRQWMKDRPRRGKKP